MQRGGGSGGVFLYTAGTKRGKINTLNFAGASYSEVNGLATVTMAAESQTLQAVTDLGATTTNVITAEGIITPKIYPSADSTTAVGIYKADGTTNVLNVDTTNGRVGIGTTTPLGALDVRGRIYGGTVANRLGTYLDLSNSTAVPRAAFVLPDGNQLRG
jgi:hypothetical protein